MSPNSFLVVLCMEVRLVHLAVSTLRRPIDMFLCFPPPRPPRYRRMTFLVIPPRRWYGYLSPSLRSRRLDQCSLFAMICWTFSTFHPCRAFHIFYPFFCLCIVLLLLQTSPLLHVFLLIFYPVSYPSSPCITLISFPQCFPYSFRPSPVALYRFLISLVHLPSSFCLKVEALLGIK